MTRPHNHDIDDDDEFIDLGQDPNDRLLALLDQAIDYRDRDLHNQSREDDGGGRDHICPGISCPFVELNGDSTFVCSVSGRCVGQQHVSSPFTAGITRGIDENGVRTGKQPAVRRASVRSHASMIFASQMAMATARTMIEKNVEMQPLTSTCCDEAATLAEARHANPPKRTRLSKAQGPKALTQEQIEELIRRAEAVLDELVRPAKPDNASCAAKANGKQGGAEKPLLAPESALASYVHRCRMDGVVPCYLRLRFWARERVSRAPEGCAAQRTCQGEGAQSARLETHVVQLLLEAVVHLPRRLVRLLLLRQLPRLGHGLVEGAEEAAAAVGDGSGKGSESP